MTGPAGKRCLDVRLAVGLGGTSTRVAEEGEGLAHVGNDQLMTSIRGVMRQGKHGRSDQRS